MGASGIRQLTWETSGALGDAGLQPLGPLVSPRAAWGDRKGAAFGPLLVTYWKLLTTSSISRDLQAPVTPPPAAPLSWVPPCASYSAPSGPGKTGTGWVLFCLRVKVSLCFGVRVPGLGASTTPWEVCGQSLSRTRPRLCISTRHACWPEGPGRGGNEDLYFPIPSHRYSFIEPPVCPAPESQRGDSNPLLAHSAARLLPPGGPELGEPGAGPVRSPACTHRAGSLPSFSEQKQILEGSGSRCLGKVREETGKCVGRNRSAPAWAPARFWVALDPSILHPDPAQGTFHRLLRVFSPLPPRGAAVLRAEGWPAPLRSAQPYLLFRGVC